MRNIMIPEALDSKLTVVKSSCDRTALKKERVGQEG
jgi:hypothetical protein